MAQRNVQNLLQYPGGSANKYTLAVGSDSTVTPVPTDFDGFEFYSGTTTNQTATARFGDVLPEYGTVDQWFFFGFEVTNYNGPENTGSSFGFNDDPDEGNFAHPVTGNGFWGITFRYTGSPPSNTAIFFGINPKFAANPAEITFDASLPILVAVDDEFSSPSGITPANWVSGFSSENASTFDKDTGVWTPATGAALSVPNPQAAMLSGDSFLTNAGSADSYPNLVQDSLPNVQVIPNGTPGQTLAQWVALWDGIADRTDVRHFDDAAFYRVNLDTTMIPTRVACLDSSKNDVDEGVDSAAVIFGNIETAVANYKSEGIPEIVIFRCPPKDSWTTENAIKDSLNTLIDALGVSDPAVTIFPLDTIMIGNGGDPDKVQVFPIISGDGFHPNADGMILIEAQLTPLIETLLLESDEPPVLISPYPNLSNVVGDIVNQELASDWFNPGSLTFEVFQVPESAEAITGLPGACSVAGELTTRSAYSVQVKATDVFTGLSTLSNVFTWSVEQLAINASLALDLSGQGGPVIGVVEITAFDVAVTDLDSGTDLIPRKLYARVTGDVVLIGLDGVEFTYEVVTVGIQDVGFVQINSVGTAGTIDDYQGLL